MTNQQFPEDSDTSLSILLVEDNTLNQQFVVAMLNEWKHRIDVACDGEEALRLHKNGKYDLILMDLLMPVMDGIEATKKIREREIDSPYRVTVVAMTANLAASNQEQCLSVGMDDYFSKPFMVQNFHTLIKKHARLRDLEEKSNFGTSARFPFDYAQALRQVDPVIISMIAKPLLEDLPEQLLKMRRSWEKLDLPVFQREAHTLSGLLGTFNAEPAQRIASEIDRSVRTCRVEKVKLLIQRLEDEVDLFSQQLRRYECS